MTDLETLKRLVGLDTNPSDTHETNTAWDDLEYWAATLDWPAHPDTPYGCVNISRSELSRIMRLCVEAHLFLAKELETDVIN